MDYVLNFLLANEYVISIFLAFIVFGLYMPKRKYYYLTLLFGFLIMEVFWNLEENYFSFIAPFNYIILFMMFFIIIYSSFKANFYQCLFLVTSTYALQHINFKLTMTFVYAFGGYEVWMSWYYFLISTIVIICTSLLVYFLFTKRFKKDNEIQINNFILLIITSSVIVGDIFLSFYTQNMIFNTSNHHNLYIDFNIYGILLNVVVLILTSISLKNRSLKVENETLELLLKKDEERYRLAKITSEEINIKYHDLKHKINNNEFNQEEVQEIKDNGLNYESLYFTGSKALDLLLTEKKRICNKEQIDLLITVDGKILNFMKSYEIYSLFGNLLDNAIDATKRLKNDSLKYIKVKVHLVRDNVFICVENFTDDKLIFESDGLPRTTKLDSKDHGYGLKSIRRIVYNYNGYFKIDFNNKRFIIKIVMPYIK